jgi:hypothetical protein
VIFDTFPIRDELDLLACRMTELEDVPNLVHVAVEADVDHQDHPKPYHLSESLERFDTWKGRLVVVRASGLPTRADFPDPWAREHAQREWCWDGLRDAAPDDVVLHGDVDEIPTALAARYVRPKGFVRFRQVLYTFAVDWLHPDPWWGTVAGRVQDIGKFADMRTARCHMLPELPDAGWHLSWLGGGDEARRKINSFCHPEVLGLLDQKHGSALDRLDECYRDGFHTDDQKLTPVDVDDSWPRWIVQGNAPASWYRPRGVEG